MTVFFCHTTKIREEEERRHEHVEVFFSQRSETKHYQSFQANFNHRQTLEPLSHVQKRSQEKRKETYQRYFVAFWKWRRGGEHVLSINEFLVTEMREATHRRFGICKGEQEYINHRHLKFQSPAREKRGQ
jgi:hypothetical protein